MNKIFKTLLIMVCFTLLFTQNYTLYASSNISQKANLTINEDGCAGGFDVERITDNINSVCYEPISEPNTSYNDSTRSRKSSFLNIEDTQESTDITLNLDSLTDDAVQNEQGNGNLHVLFPMSTINYYKSVTIGNTTGTNIQTYMQGGCTDGNYYFYYFNIIDKINSSTKQHLGSFIITCHFDNDVPIIDSCHTSYNNIKMLELEHGNCMTYNSLTDEIVIACGDTKKQTVYKLNASYFRNETTNLTSKKYYISGRITTIAYNETLNRYLINISGQHNYFCVLDSEFNLISRNTPTNIDNNEAYNGLTAGHQGLYCDNSYVYALYFFQSTDESPLISVQNVLAIFDWNGNLKKEINLSFNRQQRGSNSNQSDSYEFENLIVNKDKILLGLNCKYSNNSGTAKRHYYYYDLSSEFFHVQYCPDENISNGINSNNKIITNVLYNLSTPTRKNTFIKSGHVFVGWSLYNVNDDKWYYSNSNGDSLWCNSNNVPAGYTKKIYTNKQSVSKTVSKGKTVLFCANWQSTNKFYVSFNSNGGTGNMASQEVTYGTSKTMPSNTFSKSGRTFQGWLIYNDETGKWLYENSSGTTGWYLEGTAPVGYIKKAYTNNTTIARTVPAGQHTIFYAKWNEFIILYDANGKSVKANSIKAPTLAIYNTTNTVPYYSSNSTDEGAIQTGYRQHRLEVDKWRYVNKTDSSDTKWFNKQIVDTNVYKLYSFTGTTVTKTAPIGEHVVFQAQWA